MVSIFMAMLSLIAWIAYLSFAVSTGSFPLPHFFAVLFVTVLTWIVYKLEQGHEKD